MKSQIREMRDKIAGPYKKDKARERVRGGGGRQKERVAAAWFITGSSSRVREGNVTSIFHVC